MIRNKEGTTSDINSLPRLDVQNEVITDKITNNATSNNQEQSGIELSESDLQLQVNNKHHHSSYLNIYRYYKRCIHVFYTAKSQLYVRNFIEIYH